ncbi:MULTISPECIES: RICIN domain-containing protein [unclassified Streptomyces]|uniref:RICIN domain-containing protein n=1 Tax=unclassified Streptomyces TaxID=2593676 RepID=UPI00343D5300
MPRARFARLLAVAGVAALMPLAGASSAHAATYVGIYALYNDTTGKCADLPNYGPNPLNTPVTQYNCTLGTADNQMWDLEYTRTDNGVRLYQFVNDKSGYCLDLPNYGSDPAGTKLYTYTCNSNPASDNQEWYFNDVTGNGDYEIVNDKDGLCLDVSGLAGDGTDLANNLPLTVYPCYNSSWTGGYISGYDDHLWKLAS